MSKLTSAQLSVVVCLALGLITAALYWPVRHHDFIRFYDDAAYITDNPHVTAGLTWPGVVWAFHSGYAANWHPLTWMSHMLDCQLYGLNPAGHHLTNLFFHIANTLLLFLWLKQITAAFWRSAFVAALFAWHPLHVESVAWAAERKDVLSAFFWFLTLIFYTRYAQNRWGSGNREQKTGKALNYGFALVCFACGLMSKPMVVTLPFVLLLLDFWPLNRFNRPAVPGLLLEKLPFLALSAAGSAITYFTQQAGGAFWSPNVLPWEFRLENAVVAYARYISKTFWPSDLALIYPYPHHWPAIVVAGAALMLAMWSGLFVWRAQKNPHLFVGWFWFLGTLVPAIGLVQVGVQSMADRYMYLPSIGLFIAVVWGLHDLAMFRPRWQTPVALAGSVALAGCLVVTNRQLDYWQNSLKLLLHTARVTTGNYAACDLIGNVLEHAGRTEDALSFYSETVRIEPDFPMGQFDLGMLLLETGRREEASNHLAAAAQLMPRNPEVQYDFGTFLEQQGRAQPAVERFRSALQSKPDFPAALNDLAWILATDPDPQIRSGPEAVRLASRACELTRHQQASCLTTLSAAFAENGQYSNAIVTVQQACDLARAGAQTNLVAQDKTLLKLYQAGQPFRQSR